MYKALVLGSNGLVGKTVTNKFNNSNVIKKVIPATRKDANLFLTMKRSVLYKKLPLI